MRPPPSIARVRRYYDRTVTHEKQRLDENVYRRLERDMTLRLIEQHTPRGAKLLDVGGGPGAYLEPLTRLGYQAWLCDLSAANVRRARERARALGLQPLTERIRQANATDLRAYRSGTFGGALVAGPFYHLLERSAQEQALAEIVRVVQPGGVLVCNVLPRLHPLRYLVREASAQSWRCLTRVDTDALLDSGTYRNPLTDPLFFTDAYFWRIEEFCALLRSAGCQVLDVASAESFCAFADDSLAAWVNSEARYRRLFALVEQTARDPGLIGAAEHILVVASTPSGKKGVRKA
jgi:ubiquinone/menaquinone biosynthesis C-methylase UbiE